LPDAETVSVLVRATARLSFLFFFAAFAAAALARAWRTPVTQWLAQQETAALRALPVAHLVHYGAVLWLAVLTGYANLGERGGAAASLALGMAALAVMAARALVTWPRGAARLRPLRVQAWGLWALWPLFAVAYTPRAAEETFYLPFAVALWGGLILRLLSPRPPQAAGSAPGR
jgi:hypothetical protein